MSQYTMMTCRGKISVTKVKIFSNHAKHPHESTPKIVDLMPRFSIYENCFAKAHFVRSSVVDGGKMLSHPGRSVPISATWNGRIGG
jgi:hypothetical protein